MADENKWAGFEHPSYRIVDIGRTASFFIPIAKINLPSKEEGKTIETVLHEFLRAKFGGFHMNPLPSAGVWVNATEQVFFDNCLVYSVSFPGKERIPMLLVFLADLARQMNEECLLISAGQYDALLYPTPL